MDCKSADHLCLFLYVTVSWMATFVKLLRTPGFTITSAGAALVPSKVWGQLGSDGPSHSIAWRPVGAWSSAIQCGGVVVAVVGGNIGPGAAVVGMLFQVGQGMQQFSVGAVQGSKPLFLDLDDLLLLLDHLLHLWLLLAQLLLNGHQPGKGHSLSSMSKYKMREREREREREIHDHQSTETMCVTVKVDSMSIKIQTRCHMTTKTRVISSKWCTCTVAALVGCYMADVTLNFCCLGACSVYAIQPCTSLQSRVTSSKATYVQCMCA